MSSNDRVRAVCVMFVACGLLLAAGARCARGQSASPFTVSGGTNSIINLSKTDPPTRTWEMLGNFDFFTIRDGANPVFQIDKLAPAQSLRIHSNGRIIFGSMPGDLTPQRSLNVFDQDLPALRLQQTTFNGHLSQSYDLESSDFGFKLIDQGDILIPDAALTPFAVEVNTPTNTLYLDSSGSVGIGTSTPDANARLDIRSTLQNGLLTKCSNANPHYLRVENTAGIFRSGVQGNGDAQFGALSPGKGLNLLAGGTSKMSINSSGQVSFGNPPPAVPVTDAMMTSTGAHLTVTGVWTDNSSRAAKQDIQPITSKQARDTVRALQPMTYRYKVQPEEPYAGFIAEDVPELVATSDRKSLAPMDFVAVLTKVVQDQDRELTDERQRNEKERQRSDKLERLVDALTQRVTDLEQRLEGATPAK